MKYSIIVPVYNKAHTLSKAIDSILSQKNNSSYEIVIVNDGSTDQFEKAVECYADNEKIRIISQANGGVSSARNAGICESKGEYICFLDADDMWFDNHLSTLDMLIENYPYSKMFITSHKTISESVQKNSNLALKGISNDTIYVDDFIGLVNDTSDCIIQTNSVCICRSFFEEFELFFSVGDKIGEDTDVWYRAALFSPVVISKETTSEYNRMNSTATKNTANTLDWVFARRYFEIINDSRITDNKKESYLTILDRYYLTCARDLKCSKKTRQAFVFLRKVRKKRWHYWVTLFMMLCPSALVRSVIH